jgi:hypothetical protein
MIMINGRKVTGRETEYGVERDGEPSVIEFGDDLAAASVESLTFGGVIRERLIYHTEWVASRFQIPDTPGDELIRP